MKTPKIRILGRISTAEIRAETGRITATLGQQLRLRSSLLRVSQANANIRALSDDIATSIPGLPSTANVGPTSTSEPGSGSKAWIAGAVVGPILGLALIGFGVWLFLRRKKKASLAPQHGTASMAPTDPSQPPAGVGGYTDAKPQFAPAQPTYYNQPGQPDAYAQQGYPQQGGFSPPQGSPAPQYGFQQSAYNATANSPPGAYIHDAKYEGDAAELGGDSMGVASAAPGSPAHNAAPTSQAAELSGADANPHGEGLSGNKQQ